MPNKMTFMFTNKRMTQGYVQKFSTITKSQSMIFHTTQLDGDQMEPKKTDISENVD